MRRLLLPFVLASALISPVAARGAITPREFTITSFDGTPIHGYFFVARPGRSSPTILRTHGWGGSADATDAGTVHALLAAGYNVVTWDSRGFGQSGGQAEIDAPQFEGRDVRAIVDHFAHDRNVLRRGGDPVLGMSGGSYAGGIQFVAAALDRRIDAIAPEIAWHDLPQALFPNDVPKLGWDSLLYAAGQSGMGGYVQNQTFKRGMAGSLDPRVHECEVETAATNEPAGCAPFFAARSVSNVTSRVHVPALIMQGTIDTLFPMNHGIANARDLAGDGDPVKLVFFNGGHTLGSNVPAGDARAHMDAAIIHWFDRYLKRESVSTGAAVEYQDQNAVWHAAASYPAANGAVIAKGESGPLPVTPLPLGGGEPANANPDVSQASARIPVMTAARDTPIVGVPHVDATVTGVAPDAFVFFKLVDTDSGVVLDDQVTPERASVASTPAVHLSFDLNGVSWIVPKGHHLALEISTGETSFTTSRVAGVVELSVRVEVPVIEPATAARSKRGR